MTKKNNTRGFTLIELLIVIGIIGFIAAAILVAVDPVKRIQDSRNSQRFSEVNAILNAFLKKQVDDIASYDGEGGAPIIQGANGQIIVNTTPSALCNAPPATSLGCAPAPGTLVATGTVDCFADLSALVPTFLAEIPVDPVAGFSAAAHSGYYIQQTTLGGRIEIGACAPEQGETINVKR